MGTQLKAAAASKTEARARVELQRTMTKLESEAELARAKVDARTAEVQAKMERDVPKRIPVEKPRSFRPYAWGARIIGSIGIAAIVVFNTTNETISRQLSEKANADLTDTTGPVTDVANNGVDQMLVSTGTDDFSFTLMMMGGLVTVLIGGYTVLKARSTTADDDEMDVAEDASKSESYQSQWEALRDRQNDLMVKWSQYETDVALMIDYPIMTDYTDPVIAKVITAMQQMRAAELLIVDEVTTPVYGSKMLSAVNSFELAFATAEKYARRYGQTKLDPREQRKLSAARQALNIILDEQAPAHEVEAAYKSLRSSLNGIIDLPQRAVHVLETKVRRELTVA